MNYDIVIIGGGPAGSVWRLSQRMTLAAGAS